ncbi:hypothetical protein KVT40_003624 [Elsinoe batatas]|uniref:Tse2 ADP-ribosyltransferase toxin domain-containing protein n=1 Tax=Elsinoe batatas TaxID=2601811 RepID=A0A8K0PFD5_9PEZI|nr:hypothetical protein KVT40_003624 [Elsinoe batatas]
MSLNRFINSFSAFPKQLFRMNNGAKIRLRAAEGPSRPKRSFDLLTLSGKVQPKATTPHTYEWPNGASMRPNSATLHELLLGFRGANVIVYEIPRGTTLPDDLILVHEFADHYSLQAAKEMSVEELNKKLTAFFAKHGRICSRDEWFEKYPNPTE